jgi:hypothetical protein
VQRGRRTGDKLEQQSDVLLVHILHDGPEPLDEAVARRQPSAIDCVAAQVPDVDVGQPGDEQLKLRVAEDAQQRQRHDVPQPALERLDRLLD